DAGGEVAALHAAGLEHVLAVGAVARVGAGGLAGHLRQGGAARAAAVARPSPVARGAGAAVRCAAGEGGEHGGDARGPDHAEGAAAGDQGADVEGETLVLDVLLGVVEGPALEAVAGRLLARDRSGGVVRAAAVL